VVFWNSMLCALEERATTVPAPKKFNWRDPAGNPDVVFG
jgi:hypothetical protein